MGYTRNTGQLSYLITYDGSGNITVPASFTQTTVTSSMLKADSSGKLVAAVAGTDFVAPAGLSAYVPTTRTITINGTTFDLSADRSWSIVSGVSSFNTRTGAITLSSSDVTTALGYTPYNSTNPSGYLTTSTVLNTVLTPYTVGANTAVTATDTIETAIEKLQGQVNARVPNTRTITINGTSFDLSADRSWTIVSGLSSFNTRTGDITLLSSDVTGALGYTPVTNARTITINGTTYDLSANRTWVVDASSVSTRVVQKFTATASQTTFTVTGGYTVGMVDVFLNGVKLDNATEFTASNGSTVVLSAAAAVNDVVEVYKYGGQFIANNSLRQTTAFTATAGQTTFTVSYSVGFVDVFYNGSKLAASEFTATNGTSIVLGTACVVNDIVEVVAYNYTVGAFTGVGGSGTTNYISKWTASGTLGNSLIYDNGTNVGIGTNNPTPHNGSNALVIKGASGSRGIIEIWDGTLGKAVFQQVGGDTYIGNLDKASTGGDLILLVNGTGTSATNAMILKSSGNIGIGTNTPGQLLEVAAPNTINSFATIRINSQYYNYWDLINNSSLAFSRGGSEYMRISNTGNVGIGTSSPSINLHIASAGMTLSSTTTYSSANTKGIVIEATNGATDVGSGIWFNTGQLFSGIAGVRSNSGNWGTDLRFFTHYDTTTNQYDVVERMRITSGGSVFIGRTTDPSFRLALQTADTTQTTGSFVVTNSAGAGAFYLFNVNGTGVSTTQAQMWIEKNTFSGRSINAGGTINANGTDYAEYMVKSNTNETILKGEIVGIDCNGLLTKNFNDSVSFVVKSTNPSYVGGDTWFTEMPPTKSDDITDDEFKILLEQYELRKEQARVNVDRIAFCGQVPCNVLNAQVGDYIIPIELDGKITGQAVTNPTFEQYQISVGKVWKIMEDGRAWISVKIG